MSRAPAPTLTPRQGRVADLMKARARIDAELGRMGMDLADLPTEAPAAQVYITRAADIARRLVHAGSTHAEVAAHFRIHPDAVAGLIAPRPTRTDQTLGMTA